MQRADRWIIVGGGASGLAAAYFLNRHGIASQIVERDRAIGGRIGTVELGGRSLDCGGKNIGRRYTLFRQFAASLGDHPLEYFGLNSSQAIDGRIRTFDANARWRTMADLARGASARDLLRFARLICRVKAVERDGYLGSRYARALGRRADGAPATRYFSAEFCRRIIRPMTVRMNGAEPDEIYPGTLPSNVRMLLDTYEQFRDGFAPVLRAFAERYPVRVGASAEALLIEGGRVTGVRVRDDRGSAADLHGAGVILATPAAAAAALIQPVLPELARLLQSIAYYPVSLVIAEYDRPVFTSAARAFVFGDADVVSNAGAYGVGDRHLVRYTFSGRTYRQHASGAVDADALVRLGEAALSRYVALDAGRRRRWVARHFNPGLCAYTADHGRFLDGVSRLVARLPGLHLTGDYVQGASIEACFRSAADCVRRLAASPGQGVRQAPVFGFPSPVRDTTGGALRHHCDNTGDAR
jgi:oxygen-dependent protoporphyrinogen oxidase